MEAKKDKTPRFQMASHVLSKEERNFYCFAIASVDLIKLPLIDILTDCIKPVDLYAKINCTPGLQLRPHQKKLCCLEPPLLPDYSKFDVSLLYTLIRNLCPSLTPTRGWGHKLNPMDTNIGDDIERLRLYRNYFYAHSLSPVIPDNDFGEYWSDLKSVIKRISTFTNESRKYNYEKELLKIEGFSFVNEDRVIYETLLKDTLNQWNQLEYKFQDEQAILIKGPEKVLYGEKAQFDAEIKQTGTSKWLVTWHKKTGDTTANINIRDEKFRRSTDRQLLIHSACKDDEAEYQAVISDGNNNYPSNAIYLHVLGEPPYIDNWNFTSDTEGLTIHCSYGVPEGSPSVCEVKWTKNAEILDLTNRKYVVGRSSYDGSRLNESYLMISSPSLEDKGIYSCTVTNTVGFASKDVTLDVPGAKISTDSEVMLGQKTTIKSVVSSCPPPYKVEWQNINDGKPNRIEISNSHYSGSSLSPESPLLVIPSTNFDDMLDYRLRVWNKIGDQFSNTLFLKVKGYPPNIMTNHKTCIKERTVKLICEVFPHDPDNVFWSINGEKIENSKSEVKYSEVTVKDPSLTIFNVNKHAAGSYQVTASNAEGSTQSDVIVLDKPQIILKRRQKSDGRQVFKALIDSIPSAYLAQWKVKGKDDETYTPVKGSTEEYKGTSNSLPHPVLVIKQRELLEKNCFLIEIDNFVGKSVKEILCNDNSNKSYRTKGKESTEWEKKDGSRVVSNDSELSSDSNTDDEESYWKKEDGERKKLAKKKQKAKDMTFLRPTAGHLFSKGIQNQKDVLPSIVRAEVSKSVGLIHIDGNAMGTGFRVGENYIVTCAHVINDAITAMPHFIDSERTSIEFGRTLYNKKEDPHQIFRIIDIKYLDREYDFAVLELDAHDTGVSFPPALTCFGKVCCSHVYLVGHPNCRQMMEDNVIPYWLPKHNEIILPDIKKLGDWSKGFFPYRKDYYVELSYPPRKIMFHTTFNQGSSGSPGVVIKDEKPCVVLMVRGGVPSCIYDGTCPTYGPMMKDDMKVEYGYAMEDIYEKMRNSSLEKDRNLASEIFKTWKC